jgi:restriction system protein
MAEDWQDYQEEVAKFFRSLGLKATTNFTVQGVRTTHDVDVFVEAHHVGFVVRWIIECKYWKSPVTKLHVLALREIVADVGADRGILLSESGFQSGASEAAALTNVHLNSLVSLRQTANAEIVAMRLRELFDRVETCKERYWNIPKEKRIECGLRPDVGAAGYSATQVIDLGSELLSKAFRGVYPIEPEGIGGLVILGVGHRISTPSEIIALVEPRIADLEKRLDLCEVND